MQPNNPAAIPTVDISLDQGDVPLNQPFPREVANAPIVILAEQVGQTAVESSLNPHDTEAKISIANETARKSGKKNSTNKHTEKETTTQSDKSKRKSADQLVKILVIVGIVAVTTGLLLFFVNIFLGILVIMVGSLPIVFAVFGPLKVKKQH